MKSLPTLLKKRKWFVFTAVLLFLLNTALVISYLRLSSLANAGTVAVAKYPELTSVDMQSMTFSELSSYLKKIADVKGAEYGFEILKRAELPKKVDTHLLAHTIGDMLFKQKGAEGIQYCTHDFRNACSHSIVIGLFLEKGEKAIAELAPLCKKAPGGKGAYGMCFHGLGHGVLALSDYDMQQAVRICDGLSTGDNKQEARECIGGTMMEMASGVHDREVWKRQVVNYFTSDPLSPCNQQFVPAYAKPICYTYLTPHLVTEAGGTLSDPTDDQLAKAYQYCNPIPLSNKAERIACFGGFGKEFVVMARNKDIRDVASMTADEMKKVYRWCGLTSEADGRQHCLFQALTSLYWGGENDRSAAKRFCAQAEDELTESSCYLNLTGLVGHYIDEKDYKVAYCREIPSPYAADCKRRLL
jgi:hypothetical protein